MVFIIRNRRSLKFIFIIIIFGISLYLLSCGKDMPVQKLEKADFALNLPQSDEASPFEKVKIMKMDSHGNLFILDSGKNLIFKFDSLGNFIKLFGGQGTQCGKLNFPSGMDIYQDSLLLIHNRGTIDLLDLDGNCLRFIMIRGLADFSISPRKTIVLNRMNGALELGFFIEAYDLNGKQINTFGPPRGEVYKNRNADFAFTGFTSDNNLVYVPAFLDSIYIYDMEGNILKRARRAIPKSIQPKVDEPLELLVEDICVANDRIFVLRVDKEKSTETEIYVRQVAAYNLDLELINIYELPESITMSIEAFGFSPWYHKFVVKDNLFIFMVSKPVEHVVSFTPKK